MSIATMKKRLQNHHSITFLVAISLFIIAQLEGTVAISQWFTQDRLYDSNQAYLAAIEARSVTNYVRLSTIHATLSTMQSAEVGIDFIVETNVNIGQELDELTQLTAWGTRYTSFAVFSGVIMQNVLIASRDVTPLIYKIILVTAFIYGIFGVFGWHNAVVKAIKFGRLMILVFMFVHLVVPYSVHAAAYLSKSILAERIDESSDYFKRVHAEYSGQKSKENVKKRAHSLVSRVEVVLSKIENKVETLLLHTIKYFISEFIMTILIPIGLLYGLITFVRQLASRYLLHPLELRLSSN